MERANIVAKYSGDPFVDPSRHAEVNGFATDLSKLSEQVSGIIVVSVGGGAGNRGAEKADDGMSRVRADQSGMMASIRNAATLAEILASDGANVYGFKSQPHSLVEAELGSVEGRRVNSALPYESAGQLILKASKERGIIIAGGGTGFGRVSTDTGAVFWALNLSNPGTDFTTKVLKGTSVPGVFPRDPRKYPDEKMMNHLNYKFCIDEGIEVMDKNVWPMLSAANIATVVYQNGFGNLLEANRGLIGSRIDNQPMAEAYRVD